MPFRFGSAVLKRIEGYVGAGLTGRQIALRLGCSYDSLRTVCARRRISLKQRAADPDAIVCVPISYGARKIIGREAERRGVSTTALMLKVIEVVAADGLWAAVLDDSEGIPQSQEVTSEELSAGRRPKDRIAPCARRV